jgi:cytidine deaminase
LKSVDEDHGSVNREERFVNKPEDNLTQHDAALLQLAHQQREQAFVPHSRFAVGAALRTRSGRVIAGCNVEIDSYSLTICAERNAVFAAVSAEGPDMRINSIAISSTNGQSCPPCGSCRQVLAQFGRDARVLFPLDGRLVVMTVDELLPLCFELGDSKTVTGGPSR